jgi:signal transduction histidine kinase
MLFDLIIANRDEIVASTRAKAAARRRPAPTEQEVTGSVSLFLEQLVETLRRDASSLVGPMQRSAVTRGAALLDAGYSVGQVVHSYGDICQAVTELVVQCGAQISADEFQVLNRCLDDAIADAVTEYSRLKYESSVRDESVRSGVLAHELRNRIATAQLALRAIRKGQASVGGSVAAMLTRSLDRMAGVVNHTLVEVRSNSGFTRPERLPLHELIREVGVEGTVYARAHGVLLQVAPVDRHIDILADHEILAGAISNLLQNGVKFTAEGGEVSLTTGSGCGGVTIEVADHCGGLPPGRTEEMFEAFQQRGADRSGLGLGLFICRKGVEVSGGQIRITDVPGTGCVFTVELPRMAAA